MTRSYPMTKAVEDQHRKKKGELEFNSGLFFFIVFLLECVSGLMSKLSRKKKKTVFYNQGTNQSKWEISHASWLLLLLLTALLSRDLPPIQAC